MIDTADEPQAQLISIFDVEAKTLRRVTPKNVQGKAPVWLNNDILFTKIEYRYNGNPK